MADPLQEVEAERLKALKRKNSKTKLLVEELCQRTANENNAETNTNLKFIHLKAQYMQLKNKLKTKQDRFFLLQSLELEQNPSVDETDSELKATSKTLDELKSQLQDAKCRIEELADQSEEKYHKLQSILAENDSILEKTINKKQKYEEELASITTSDVVKFSKETEGEVEEIAILKESVKTARCHLLTLEEECGSLKQHLHTLRIQSADLKKQADDAKSLNKLISNTANHVYTNWCKQMYELIQKLSGLSVVDIGDKVWTLECKAPEKTASKEDHSNLVIKVSFASDDTGNLKLESAEVSESSVQIQEIVNIAVKNDDLAFILLEIQKLWYKHYPLLGEIKNLRVRYAIDWLHKEGTLKVLYGRKMNIVCTLKIGDKYPALGNISLESVDGLPEGMSLEELQVPAESKADLSTWLDHLNQNLREK